MSTEELPDLSGYDPKDLVEIDEELAGTRRVVLPGQSDGSGPRAVATIKVIRPRANRMSPGKYEMTLDRPWVGEYGPRKPWIAGFFFIGWWFKEPGTVAATKPAAWNGRCARCGKGTYTGLVAVEHEGGGCE